MKKRPPRQPVVIIGAGIAGLSAAFTLEESGIPCVILERFPRVGGRFNSREGEGWIADHGTRYFMRSDLTLNDLVRKTGMDNHCVSVQGSVLRLKADGFIEVPPHGGVDPDRLCIDTGFSSLAKKIAETVHVRTKADVGAIRWDNDEKVFWWDKEGHVFWFQDEAGEPLRNPTTNEPIVGSGVILATTATAATRIVEKSKSLKNILPVVSSVEYEPCMAFIYKVPRVETAFFGLEGDPDSRIKWLSFEERKAPERVDKRFSLMVVHASPEWSRELIDMTEADALGIVYKAARAVVPQLPETPISQTYKRWNVANVTTPPVGVPTVDSVAKWEINPPYAPFALAGDYILGNRAEDAARSGVLAAQMIAQQLPSRKSFLGIELPT